LPLNIQIKIVSFINLDDIPQLSLVSKLFRSICRHNDLWKILYIRQHGNTVLKNKSLIHLAERRGWRQVFFTNRLKLQLELRREAQLEHYHQEDPSDLVKARERQTQIQPNQQQSSVRRHSYATRKESPLSNRERSARSEMGEMETDSPPLSARSNAESVTSTSSTRP
jgi:hypothetical protein